MGANRVQKEVNAHLNYCATLLICFNINGECLLIATHLYNCKTNMVIDAHTIQIRSKNRKLICHICAINLMNHSLCTRALLNGFGVDNFIPLANLCQSG